MALKDRILGEVCTHCSNKGFGVQCRDVTLVNMWILPVVLGDKSVAWVDGSDGVKPSVIRLGQGIASCEAVTGKIPILLFQRTFGNV